MGQEMKGVRVLLYHDIPDRDGFFRQADLLARFPCMAASHALETTGPAVAITFDDGWEDLDWAFPELKQRGLSATLFLTTTLPEIRNRGDREGFIRARFPRLSASRELVPLSWDELSDLVAMGLEMGAHTHTHTRLTRDVDAPGELDLPRKLIREKLGLETSLFAYAYGRRRDICTGARSLLNEHGYHRAFIGHGWPVTPGTDPLLIPRHPVLGPSVEEIREILSGRRDFRERLSWHVQGLWHPRKKL